MSIAIDGHGFWSLHNAIRVAKALEPYNILWLEEMLSPRNVDAHLALVREAKFPVCLAERSVVSNWRDINAMRFSLADVGMTE